MKGCDISTNVGSGAHGISADATGEARAVNVNNVVAGFATGFFASSAAQRGFRSVAGTRVTALTQSDDLPPPNYERVKDVAPPPAGSPTMAVAVNGSGSAVGSYYVSTGDELASAWHARSGTSPNPPGRYLWVWEAPVTGGAFDLESRALGMNGSGALVGVSRPTATTSRAVYSPAVEAPWRDLNDRHFVHGGLSWVLQEARALTAAGTIVGVGLNNGQTRGFILVPRQPGN